MKFNKLSWLLIFIVSLNLNGCNNFNTTQTSTPLPIPTTTTSAPTSTETLEPTATEVFRQNISATATDIQLPFNPEVKSDGYCLYSQTFIAKAETLRLSENKLAQKLFEKWLDHYNTKAAPLFCQIDNYTIDKVYYDERTPYFPLEPKGDIMRVVVFSIKLIQIPNYWMSLAGEIDQNNWLHTAQAVAIFKTDTGYIMKFANP